MTTIKINDGNSYIEVEVEDEFAITYNSMEKRDALDERRETRRHQSLNASIDNGFDFPDKTVNIEENAIKAEQDSELHKAIARLEPQQQELIKKVYFENVSQDEISRQLGIAKQSVSDRMARIYKQLKKLLKNI